MAWDGPKWGQEDFVPTNPDLADILGRTDLDFDYFYLFAFFGFQIPQISRSPDLQKSGLGRAWARLGWALGRVALELKSLLNNAGR